MLIEHLGQWIPLPRELRDHIMNYVLTPGHVFIGGPQAAESEAKRSRYDILRTCKQAYEEGSHIFYSGATFHLPSGSVEKTHEWMASLQSRHQVLIKRIMIDFTLKDWVSKPDEENWCDRPRDHRDSPVEGFSITDHQFLKYIIARTREVWQPKIDFALGWARVIECERPGCKVRVDYMLPLHPRDDETPEMVLQLATSSAEGGLLGFLPFHGLAVTEHMLHEGELGLGDTSIVAKRGSAADVANYLGWPE